MGRSRPVQFATERASRLHEFRRSADVPSRLAAPKTPGPVRRRPRRLAHRRRAARRRPAEFVHRGELRHTRGRPDRSREVRRNSHSTKRAPIFASSWTATIGTARRLRIDAQRHHEIRDPSDGRRPIPRIHLLLSHRPVRRSRRWRDGALQLHRDLRSVGSTQPPPSQPTNFSTPGT